MQLILEEEDVELIEEVLSMRMIEKQDKALLPIIKKIRQQLDDIE